MQYILIDYHYYSVHFIQLFITMCCYYNDEQLFIELCC